MLEKKDKDPSSGPKINKKIVQKWSKIVFYTFLDILFWKYLKYLKRHKAWNIIKTT